VSLDEPPRPELSVAILAYNEEATLEEAVRHVHDALSSDAGRTFEIIIVDDGSTDSTEEIAEELATSLRDVRLVRHPHNRGPGSGIRTGIEEYRGQIFTFFAGDLQGSFEERLIHLDALGGEADVLVGQRRGASSPTAWRKLTSAVFPRVMNLLFDVELDDFNFFYFFKREVLDTVSARSQTAFICPELMLRAHHRGFRVRGVPGTVYPRRAGKATVGRLTHVARFTAEMVRLWAELEVLGRFDKAR